MHTDLPKDRVAGTFLVASAVLTTVALAHHPAVGTRHQGDLVHALASGGPINGAFHAFMIVMILVLYIGLVGYARRRGVQSILVLGGLVVASSGLLAELGAALIDGFFIPGFGAHLARGNPASIGQGLQIIVAAALALQILAKCGLFATSAAIVLWSIDLFDGERAHVVLAIVGCAGGAVALVISSTVASTLNPHNAALAFAMQALWYGVAGAFMIRGQL